jgi:hypothetical protein
MMLLSCLICRSLNLPNCRIINLLSKVTIRLTLTLEESRNPVSLNPSSEVRMVNSSGLKLLIFCYEIKQRVISFKMTLACKTSAGLNLD